MASPLEWILKLVDRMSGPANNAARAVESLSSKLRSAEQATTSVENAHKHAAFRWNRGVKDMEASQKQFASTTTGTSAASAEALMAVEAAAIAAAAAVAVAVGALALKGAKMAIDATTFRVQTEAGLEALLGSSNAAAAAYKRIVEVADKVGLETADAAATVKRLISAGFTVNEALANLETLGDVTAVLGGSAAGAVEDFLTKMQATGKVGSLDKLGKAGIRVDGILKQLAKQTGKTKAEVEAMVKAGTIGADEMAKAIRAAIDAQIGGVAEKLGATVPRLAGDILGRIERLFDNVDLTALQDALSGVITVLDGPIGARIKGAIESIFGGLFDALFGAFGPDEIETIFGAIADTLEGIGAAVQAAAPFIQAFIVGMIDGFRAIWPAIRLAGSAMLGLVNILASIPPGVWKAMGYGLVFVAGALGAILIALNAVAMAFVAVFIGIPALLLAAVGWVISILGDIWNAITGFASSMFDAGSNLISGLVNGILSGASGVVDAIVGVATSAIGAAYNVLKIRSPSKVFEHIGAFTSVGFAQGIANDNSGPAAMEAMIEPPSAMGAQQSGQSAGRSAGATGGGGNVTLHIDQVIIQSSGKDEDYVSGMSAVLEQMRLAVGA